MFGHHGLKRIGAGVAAGCGIVALAAVPVAADASSTATVPLTAGTLAIGTLANTSLPSTSVGAGTVSGAINSGNWSDTTGSGAGWHGTIQLSTAFIDQGSWTQTSGTTTALSNSTSGSYSGTVANALVTATVVSSVGATTVVSWTDREGATTTSSSSNVTCTASTPCALSSGVTITFGASVYPAGAVYQADIGALPTTALTLATASATGPTPQGTTLGATNNPSFQNNAATVTAGGSAQQFIHATAGTGMGTFALAPGVTITWDPNNTWGGASVSYTATAQYAIVAGP